MPIVLNGNGTVTGILAGGLPDGIIQAADLASGVGGKILQIVSTTYSTQVSTTGTSVIDTGLNCSITPSSTSNKILVMSNQQFYYNISNANAMYMSIYLLRGSTIIHQPSKPNGDNPYEIAGYFRNGGHWTVNYLDSPNTTSSVTYKTQGQIYKTGGSYGSSELRFQMAAGEYTGSSYMHLLEVAA